MIQGGLLHAGIERGSLKVRTGCTTLLEVRETRVEITETRTVLAGIAAGARSQSAVGWTDRREPCACFGQIAGVCGGSAHLRGGSRCHLTIIAAPIARRARCASNEGARSCIAA